MTASREGEKGMKENTSDQMDPWRKLEQQWRKMCQVRTHIHTHHYWCTAQDDPPTWWALTTRKSNRIWRASFDNTQQRLAAGLERLLEGSS